MISTDLGGHSGCNVVLLEPNDEKPFVRKIAGNKEYNNRLKNQMEKQQYFISTSIKTPRVLGSGFLDNGLFYFDMEYIHGITLSEYLKTIEVSQISGLVESILSNYSCCNESKECDINGFIQKIESLKEQLGGLNNKEVSKALSILEFHDWSKFNKSNCHGDLTLENMIIKDGTIYLIDFLDSFYDCWILDLGTLLQDVQCMWSYRMEQKMNINTTIRLVIFRDILMNKVKQKFGDDYIEMYYALLLKLVRIYPYTTDELTTNFLNRQLAAIVEILECQKEEHV